MNAARVMLARARGDCRNGGGRALGDANVRHGAMRRPRPLFAAIRQRWRRDDKGAQQPQMTKYRKMLMREGAHSRSESKRLFAVRDTVRTDRGMRVKPLRAAKLPE